MISPQVSTNIWGIMVSRCIWFSRSSALDSFCSCKKVKLLPCWTLYSSSLPWNWGVLHHICIKLMSIYIFSRHSFPCTHNYYQCTTWLRRLPTRPYNTCLLLGLFHPSPYLQYLQLYLDNDLEDSCHDKWQWGEHHSSHHSNFRPAMDIDRCHNLTF